MAKKTTRKATKTATKAPARPRKTASKSAKRSGRRESMDTGSDDRYAKRTTSGRFADMDDVGRAQRTDKPKKAKTAVASGFGDQGDRRPAKKR